MPPSLLQIILLGLVQGAAELLPVSSSAHVIAAERIMRLDPSSPEMTYLMVMLHAGTMAAMIVYFWGAWRRSFFANAAVFRDFAARAALATAATAAVGYPLQLAVVRLALHGRQGAQIEDVFSNLPLMAASLAAAGVLIVAAGLRSRPAGRGAPAHAHAAGAIPGVPAFWIGAVQGVCLPFRGFSRSGATISTGMLLGLERRATEQFSFALAVIITPPVIAREAWRLYRSRPAAGPLDLGALAAPGLLGMACSFAAGLVALRWLSRWLENGRWHYFGFYCFAAAAGVCMLARMGF